MKYGFWAKLFKFKRTCACVKQIIIGQDGVRIILENGGDCPVIINQAENNIKLFNWNLDTYYIPAEFFVFRDSIWTEEEKELYFPKIEGIELKFKEDDNE